MKNTKAIIAWCLYDWANAAYFTVILTFVFAAYFTQKIAINPVIGTAQWGYTIALSGIIIAVLSPILGAIADANNRRKPWIFSFTLLAVIASALLWFVTPQINTTYFALTCVALGLIGVEIAIVFYNAMLKDLVPESHTGRLSGWAWGVGYAGGLLCLVISLGIDIRLCGPLVAIWLAVFSLPLLFFTSESAIPTDKSAIKQGLSTLWQTLCHLPRHKNIFIFLLARMLYINGVNTLFAFGGIYAAGTFGMSLTEIIKFGIAMNIAAGLGAASFAWLDDYIGSKSTIVIALIIMIAMGTGVLLVKSTSLFWLFGMGVSLCVGPVQAASRSLMTHLAPRECVAEMFGLYAFAGKATAFLGPWLLGLLTLHFNSQRIGMSVVVYFLVFGLILLAFVRPPGKIT